MCRLLFVLPLLTACATTEHDGLVDNPRYAAGGPPGWRVEIGDDIALRLGENFFDFPVVSATHLYPERLARRADGGQHWQSRAGNSTIFIETHPGPCTSPGGTVYPDHVHVHTRTLDLTGCGGPVLTGPGRPRIDTE